LIAALQIQWTTHFFKSVSEIFCYYGIVGDSIYIPASLTGSRTRTILRFFAPQGRQVAPMGVKFGTEKGPLLRSNFTPIGATIRV